MAARPLVFNVCIASANDTARCHQCNARCSVQCNDSPYLTTHIMSFQVDDSRALLATSQSRFLSLDAASRIARSPLQLGAGGPRLPECSPPPCLGAASAYGVFVHSKMKVSNNAARPISGSLMKADCEPADEALTLDSGDPPALSSTAGAISPLSAKKNKQPPWDQLA